MGGYGALKFGFKYPGRFVMVASMSGALGAASWTESDLKGLEAIYQSLLKTFGPPGSTTRAQNDLFKLTREVPTDGIKSLPTIYLDCGTEDPLLQTNRSYADLLVERKIPHEFRQLPGNHSWPTGTTSPGNPGARRHPLVASEIDTTTSGDPLLNFAINVARDAGGVLVDRLGRALQFPTKATSTWSRKQISLPKD